MNTMIRVLYVDDEPQLLDICKLFLERSGDFRVDTITSASDALIQLNLKTYDAIISDYQMPGMNGIEFLKEVRVSGNSIPFILFTGRGREEVVIQALNEGADFYLQKGGDPRSQFAELIHKIGSAVKQKKAEQSLQESEEQYRSVIEYVPAGMHFYRLEADGRLIFTGSNPAADTILGISHNTLKGKTIEDAFPPLADTEIPNQYRNVISSGIVWHTEQVNYQDGEIRGSFAVSAFRSAPDRMVVAFFDVTSRKRAEEELRAAYEELTASEEELRAQFNILADNETELQESEEKYRNLFENSTLGIFRTTPEGKFSAINSTFAQISGYPSSEEMLAEIQDIRTQLYVHEEDRDRFLHELRTVGFIKNFEAEFYHKGNIPGWISISANTIRNTLGEIQYFEGTIEDINEKKKIEQALRSEKTFSDTVIDSIPGLLYLYDSEGRLVRWNKSHETITGYTAEELATIHILDWYKGDDEAIATITNGVGRAFTDGQATAEANLRTKNGRRIPFFFTAKRLEIEGKIYITGVGIDISDRRQALDALQESEKRFRELSNLLPQIVYEVDSDGNLTYANQMAFELFGYTDNEFLKGLTIMQMIAPGYRDSVATFFQAMINGEKTAGHYIESLALRKDGATFPISCYSSPIYVKGRISGIRGIIIDISERKRNEEELRSAYDHLKYQEKELQIQNISLVQSQAEWESTFNAISDWITVISPEGHILHSNKSSESLIGIPAFEALSRNCFDLVHGTDCPVDGCPRMKMLKSGKREITEVAMKNGNGWLQVTVDPVLNSAGEVVSAVHIIRDITERTRTKKALEMAKKKLYLLNNVTFNDIQNLIFILSGYQDIIQELITENPAGPIIEKQQGILKNISLSLKFAQSYQNLGLKPPQWQNVNHVFLMAISHLDFLKIQHTVLLNDLEIFADPLLEHVFQILADNILTHGKTATHMTFGYTQGPKNLILFFEDDGIGIPEHIKSHIFSPDFQKQKGVGLFLAREVLEVTDICIQETGEPGKGARFEITVPKGNYRFYPEENT